MSVPWTIDWNDGGHGSLITLPRFPVPFIVIKEEHSVSIMCDQLLEYYAHSGLSNDLAVADGTEQHCKINLFSGR